MDFQKTFAETKGKPIYYKNKVLQVYDTINLNKNNLKVKLTFISTKSLWLQGIKFDIQGLYIFNDNSKVKNKVVFWEHTSPKERLFDIKSKDKIMKIHNCWQFEDGIMQFWGTAGLRYGGAAMIAEDIPNGKIYYCNDGEDDDDFDDLIFKIEFL